MKYIWYKDNIVSTFTNTFVISKWNKRKSVRIVEQYSTIMHPIRYPVIYNGNWVFHDKQIWQIWQIQRWISIPCFCRDVLLDNTVTLNILYL